MNKNRQALCEPIVKASQLHLLKLMGDAILRLGVREGDVLTIPESYAEFNGTTFPFCNNVLHVFNNKGVKGDARKVKVVEFEFSCTNGSHGSRSLAIYGVVLNKNGTWAKVQTLTGLISWNKKGELF